MTTIQAARISGFSRLGAQWMPAVEDLVPLKQQQWQHRLPAILADRSIRVRVRNRTNFRRPAGRGLRRG